MTAAQVVLADGSLDRERVLRHVGAERAVGAADVVVRAVVDDDRQFGGWQLDAFDAADRTDTAGAGDKDGGLAALVGEEVRGVDTPGRPAGREPLRVDSRLKFAERALEPG